MPVLREIQIYGSSLKWSDGDWSSLKIDTAELLDDFFCDSSNEESATDDGPAVSIQPALQSKYLIFTSETAKKCIVISSIFLTTF